MSSCISHDGKEVGPWDVGNSRHGIVSEHPSLRPPTSKSLLCDLPAELRLMIYRLLLCSDEPLLLLPYGRNPSNITVFDTYVYPSILRTCKLFNQEATYLLYSANTLSMNAWLLSKFANRNGLGLPIGKINAGSLRFLNIQYDIEKLADLACDLVEDIKPRHLVLLQEMPGLEEITLWRFDERDITHMAACCLHHRPGTTEYFISTIEATSRLLIAALQDIVENQLKGLSKSSEHGDRNASSPKIYITCNNASVRLAIKGKSLRMKDNERVVPEIAETKAEIRKIVKALTDH